VPPPEVQVAPQPAAPTITTTTVAPPPAPVTPSFVPPTAPPAPPAPPAMMQPKPAIYNIKACAPTGEDYPAPAVRAEATGTSRIRFTIDAGGALVKTEVVKSAGASREHKMLDRVAAAKLGECTFKPAIDEHGKPVGGSFEVEYVWKLD
jgi:protein TonB